MIFFSLQEENTKEKKNRRINITTPLMVRHCKIILNLKLNWHVQEKPK